MEVEERKLLSARQQHEERVMKDEERLAADRRELKQLALEQAQLANSTTKQLKEDEERLLSSRSNVTKEIKDLDTKRLMVGYLVHQ